MSAISEKSIIPGMFPELNDHVIEHLDTPSCLTLSLVSTTAHAVLSNGFFQSRFFDEHPHLEKFKNSLFLTLRNNHAHCCWKIACDSLSKDHRIKNVYTDCFFANKEKINISLPFFISETPSLCSALQLTKAECESQMTEICGNHYQDPNSQIDKAWKVLELKKQERQPLQDKIYEILEMLKLFHSEYEIGSIINIIDYYGNHFFPNGEVGEELQNKTDREISPFKRECFPQYILLYKLLEETTPLEYEINELDYDYNKIEKNRINLHNKIIKTNIELSVLTNFTSKPQEVIELVDRLTDYNEYFRLLMDKNGCELQLQYYEENTYGWGSELNSQQEESAYTGSITSLNNELQVLNHHASQMKRSLKGDLDLKENYMNLFKIHQTIIRQELYNAMDEEDNSIKCSNLEQCCIVIQAAIAEPSDGLLQHIAHLINSLDNNDLTVIWGSLYNECANGYQQDRWSELHFHEFLPELLKIVNTRADLYKRNSEDFQTG